MNININDIKNGMTVIIDGNLCTIQEFQHVKPGKGPAFVRIKLKNLKTGSTVEQTFNTNIKITKAHIDKNIVQYLYASGDNFVFMNNETYEQIEVPRKVLGSDAEFVKEGVDISIDFFEGEIIGITLPEKIEYKIIETSEAVKGNTATNAQKDATIETGKVIKVPLFISEGENVLVSTKDGKYAGRA